MLTGMNSFRTRNKNVGDSDPYYNIFEAVEGLDMESFGWLSGPAFTLIYACLVLFTGPLSDNLNRTKMICFSCIGWIMMTYGSSIATKFWHLLLTRTGLAVFMSFYGPTTLSLISDLFPQEHRTFAFSLYAIGSQAGYPLSSFNRPLISILGWRGTFQFTATLGIFVGLLGLLVIHEPERGRFDISLSVVAHQEVSSHGHKISEPSRFLRIKQLSDESS